MRQLVIKTVVSVGTEAKQNEVVGIFQSVDRSCVASTILNTKEEI